MLDVHTERWETFLAFCTEQAKMGTTSGRHAARARPERASLIGRKVRECFLSCARPSLERREMT